MNETGNQRRNSGKGDKDVIEDDRTLASELSSLSTDSSSHDFVKCRYSPHNLIILDNNDKLHVHISCYQHQSLTKSSSSPSIRIKFL